MIDLNCKKLGCDYAFEMQPSRIGKRVTCPTCGTEYEICYEEFLDRDGEEDCYFWLEIVVE